MFKTSRVNLQMMCHMDEARAGQHLLKGSAAFFDTTFQKIEGFKTLGMWVYHPGEIVSVVQFGSVCPDLCKFFMPCVLFLRTAINSGFGQHGDEE